MVIIATLFMGVGYAALNSLTLGVKGNLVALSYIKELMITASQVDNGGNETGEILSYTGTLLNLNDVSSGLILGRCGYDFIWVDMEHSCLSLENLLAQITAIKSGGTSVIVRVPQNDLTYTKKVLEMGVDGIIFPMLKSVEEVNEMIACTLYPPYGTRGFGPQNAIGYGFDDARTYVQNTREHLCRFIQIEHQECVKNLEEILKNPYIDGYIFGLVEVIQGEVQFLQEILHGEAGGLIVELLRAEGEQHQLRHREHRRNGPCNTDSPQNAAYSQISEVEFEESVVDESEQNENRCTRHNFQVDLTTSSPR